MNLIKLIFTGIIIFFLFIFVFVFSYFPGSKVNLIDINVKWNDYIWLSKILQKSWEYSYEKIKKIEKNIFTKDNIDKIDEFYFIPDSTKSYQSKITWNNVKIDIEEWLFFANIVDLTYSYNILNKNFTLTPKSPWKFYFDTRDSSKVKIFSFDSIVEISLLNPNNKEKLTTMVLYPHMNFTFNSSRNKIVKNADLLRLESVFDINYIKDSFLTLKTDEFVKKIYKSENKEALSFLENIANIVYNKWDFSKYSDINNLLIQSSYTLPWINYITKYFVLFLNDSKKVIYYKNNVLINLNDLSKSTQEFDINSNKEKLKENILKLKEISQEDYEEMYDLITYYYNNLLKINDVWYINNAFALSKILVELDWNNFKNKNTNSSFLLSKLYNIIDNSDFWKVKLQENIISYLTSFFKENWITIDDTTKSLIVKNWAKVTSDLESLSFFLKNVLLYNTTFSDKNANVLNTISILKDYYYINNSLTILTKNKYESLIIEYSSILDKVLLEMRKSFFSEDLDENWLLVLNKNNLLSKNDLDSLDSVIKLFFTFNEKYNSYLSEKNVIYNRFYDRNKKEYDEYFLALDNYNEYSIRYNETKNELLSTKSLLETTENIVLSKENFEKYIKQFFWIDLSNYKLDIINNEYYKAEGIFINGAKFDFELYPKNQNLLDSISKNWISLNLSYELDSLEYDLKDLYEDADDEQKDIYDFRRFFLNTFFWDNLPTKDATQFVYESNEPKEEDRSISLFKRDKLVWSKWDFSLLKWFLDVDYNDVIVKLDGDKYDITLSWSKLTTTIKSNDTIYWTFSSKYYFSETDHYFSNIKIVLYTESWKWVKSYFFDWKPVYIPQRINTKDFKEEITEILEKRF